MKTNTLIRIGVVLSVALVSMTFGKPAAPGIFGFGKIKHVLLLSIDGMHAVDFYNCANGVAGVNGGKPYCPNMAALGQTGINYVNVTSSRPSDSFPGITALVSGGSPKTTGVYYDVAYDRSLDAPAVTTWTGLAAGPCTPYGQPTGTTTDYNQGIDRDDTKLNGGAPGAAITEGGVASIDPNRLVRDPKQGCRYIPGISSAPTLSLASFTRRVATQRGLTSIRPILLSPARAAPAWTTCICPRWTQT